MTKTLPLGLLLGLCAGLLAACAAPPPSATSTYTLLATATRTLTTSTPVAASITASPSLQAATATVRIVTPLVVEPTERRQPATEPPPAPTPTRPTPKPVWTPPPYTPPVPDALSLSPLNAEQAVELAVIGNGRPADATWSPDDTRLAVAATDWVDLYDTASWQLVAHYELPAQHVAFSPTGRFLVAVGDATVRWLDLATGEVFRTQGSAPGGVNDILFSPNGEWLALLGVDYPGVGDPNYVLEVINATNGERQFVRSGYNGWADLAFSRDSQTLAFANPNDGVLVLDPTSGRELASNKTIGYGIDFTLDGNALLVLTQTGLQTLTLATGAWQPVSGIPSIDGFVLAPDGRTVALAESIQTGSQIQDQLVFWDLASQVPLATYPSYIDVARLSFSSDSRRVAWVDYQGSLQTLDLAAPVAIGKLPYIPPASAVTFGPPAPSGSPMLLAGDREGGLWTWDFASGVRLAYVPPIPDNTGRSYDGTLGAISSLDYSARDQLLVTGYDIGEVRVTNVATGENMAVLPCPDLYYAPVRLSQAGGVFAADCKDHHREHLWDVHTGARLTNYTGRSAKLIEVQGAWLRIIYDKTESEAIEIWPLVDATPIKLTFPADIYFNSVVHWAASATGPWLAGNDYDAGIVIWEAASGRWLQRLMGHKAFYGDGATDGVTALTFSPNTDLLASGGADGTVRLWDPATGAELRRFDVSAGSITDLAFSADGRYLAASTSAGVVRVYGLPSP